MKTTHCSFQVRLGLLLTLTLGLLFSACASTTKAGKAHLVREDARMFWTLTGTDAKGNPSTVYIQGTIHVGDERLFPFAETVLRAWNSADRIAGEISSEGYEQIDAAMQGLVLESYLNANGRNIYDYLTQAQKDTLFSVLDKEMADSMSLFEPWVLTSQLTNVLYTDSGFSPEYGLDQWFTNRANAEGKTMLGLDSLDVQLDILRFGTYEQQICILQEALDDLAQENANDEEIEKLYEFYLNDDEEGIASLVKEEFIVNDPSQRALAEEYNKMLYDDRNTVWADKIKTWLLEGGTTFIFAGTAHFVGDNSVFYYLEQNGTISRSE